MRWENILEGWKNWIWKEKFTAYFKVLTSYFLGEKVEKY
jgi:hypothetical protein